MPLRMPVRVNIMEEGCARSQSLGILTAEAISLDPKYTKAYYRCVSTVGFMGEDASV